MKYKNYKITVSSEDPVYLVDNRIETKRKKILLLTSGLLTFFTLVILFIFIYQSANEINNLKQQVEELKVAVKDLNNLLNSNENINDITDSPMPNDYTSFDDLDDENTDDFNSNEDEEEEYSFDFIINIEKMLNLTDTIKEANREKREIIGNAQDELIEVRRKNKTLVESLWPTTSSPLENSFTTYDSIQHQPYTARPLHSRKSRVMHQNRINLRKKSSPLRNRDYNSNSQETDFTVVAEELDSRVRHRHLEDFDERHPRMGRMRPLPTAHFSGTTSKYILGQHSNFKGNGHMRHLQQIYVDWEAKNWMSALGMNRYYSMIDGVLTIKETGLYFIYAQIYHLDEHDINGFRVYKNDATILQCTTTGHSSETSMKGNTCFTAGAEYLEENDRISLGDLFESRYSLFEAGKSFFGIIKIGDIKIK